MAPLRARETLPPRRPLRPDLTPRASIAMASTSAPAQPLSALHSRARRLVLELRGGVEHLAAGRGGAQAQARLAGALAEVRHTNSWHTRTALGPTAARLGLGRRLRRAQRRHGSLRVRSDVFGASAQPGASFRVWPRIDGIANRLLYRMSPIGRTRSPTRGTALCRGVVAEQVALRLLCFCRPRQCVCMWLGLGSRAGVIDDRCICRTRCTKPTRNPKVCALLCQACRGAPPRAQISRLVVLSCRLEAFDSAEAGLAGASGRWCVCVMICVAG